MSPELVDWELVKYEPGGIIRAGDFRIRTLARPSDTKLEWFLMCPAYPDLT